MNWVVSESMDTRTKTWWRKKWDSQMWCAVQNIKHMFFCARAQKGEAKSYCSFLNTSSLEFSNANQLFQKKSMTKIMTRNIPPLYSYYHTIFTHFQKAYLYPCHNCVENTIGKTYEFKSKRNGKYNSKINKKIRFNFNEENKLFDSCFFFFDFVQWK